MKSSSQFETDCDKQMFLIDKVGNRRCKERADAGLYSNLRGFYLDPLCSLWLICRHSAVFRSERPLTSRVAEVVAQGRRLRRKKPPAPE